MSNKRRRGNKASPRAEPNEKRSLVWYTDSNNFDSLTCSGYTSLAQNPEVLTAVDTIARWLKSKAFIRKK